jgi:ABC-2 type transport system permease protein
VQLYWAVAVGSFHRYSTYVGATVAGIFTNSVFGLIICFVYQAVWTANPGAGGYDETDALTFVWISQGLLMPVALFGGGSPDDLGARIKSGDVAIDFYRPVGILGSYLAADLGRAAYHLVTRGVAPFVVGALVFDLRYPSGPLAVALFALAVLIGVTVSFAIRMLAALSAFWLLDDTGPRNLLLFVAIFFSGMTVPLVLFPDGLRQVAMALPFATLVQLPADLWLGQATGLDAAGGLALALGWLVVMLGVVAGLLRLAERRVVVQGG